MSHPARLLPLIPMALCLAITSAHAQYFTNHSGYTSTGQYQVHLELSPYLWLPVMDGSFSQPAIQNGASGSSLNSSVHSSFMVGGLLRFGPYSAELGIQYAEGASSKPAASAPGGTVRLQTSYVRLAPGLGYQIYRGNIFNIPSSADLRAGFAFYESWWNLNGEGNLTGAPSGGGNFIQPWAGTRIDFIPAPHWRIDLNALAQGMGIANGSWGWAASGVISYAVNDWFDVNAGYSAINTQHGQGGGAPKRTLELNAYGPVLGVSFRFGG